MDLPFPQQGQPAGTVLIDGFTIRDAYNDQTGVANAGGGIRGDDFGRITLRNCTVRNNQALGGGGGMATSRGRVDLVASKFVSNIAGKTVPPVITANGGALWLERPGADCYIQNVEFKNNTATGNGGGFFFQFFNWNSQNPNQTPEAWVRFANVLFSGNSATGTLSYGGAGFVKMADPPANEGPALAEFVNCTFAANTAFDGAALRAEESPNNSFPGRVQLFNCIVSTNDNTSTSKQIIYATAGDVVNGVVSYGESDVDYTIVEPPNPPGAYSWDCSSGSCFTTPPSCTNFACAPSFVGSTYRLASGSQGIDEGLFVGAPIPLDVFDLDGDGNTTEVLPIDLDLRPRVQGSEIDMGCYEF